MGWLPHAYWIELIQLLAAVAAVAHLLWALYDAWKDEIKRRKAKVNGPLEAVALGNVIRGIFRVTKSILFLVGGVASVLLPPPHEVPLLTDGTFSDEKIAIVIGRAVLILATVLLMADAIVERWFRQKHARALRGEP
jgi:hypothetical protein